MDYKNYLEEIRELLWSTWNTKEVSDNEFNSIKKELEKIYEDSENSEALFLISELHIHKSNSIKKNAINYSLKGLVSDYNNVGLHDNFNICSNGIMVDFKKRNHNKIIEYYFDFIKLHTHSLIGRIILIENLIDNYRFDEALSEIKDAYKISGAKTYLLEIYEGEILFKRGYQKEAIEFWQDICEKNKNNYKPFFSFADQCANLALYDLAIENYKKSFELQKSPRMIDSLISLFQVYEIQKNYSEALNTVNLILEVYEEDHGLIDDEELIPYLKDKERLENLL